MPPRMLFFLISFFFFGIKICIMFQTVILRAQEGEDCRRCSWRSSILFLVPFRKVTYILLQSRHKELKNIVQSWKGSTKQFSLPLSWCCCCFSFWCVIIIICTKWQQWKRAKMVQGIKSSCFIFYYVSCHGGTDDLFYATNLLFIRRFCCWAEKIMRH